MASSAFVFIDETGASTNIIRQYGWDSRGERLVDAAPHGHWFTTTFVAGLREDGVIAPLVLHGPMNGDCSSPTSSSSSRPRCGPATSW